MSFAPRRMCYSAATCALHSGLCDGCGKCRFVSQGWCCVTLCELACALAFTRMKSALADELLELLVRDIGLAASVRLPGGRRMPTERTALSSSFATRRISNIRISRRSGRIADATHAPAPVTGGNIMARPENRKKKEAMMPAASA